MRQCRGAEASTLAVPSARSLAAGDLVVGPGGLWFASREGNVGSKANNAGRGPRAVRQGVPARRGRGDQHRSRWRPLGDGRRRRALEAARTAPDTCPRALFGVCGSTPRGSRVLVPRGCGTEAPHDGYLDEVYVSRAEGDNVRVESSGTYQGACDIGFPHTYASQTGCGLRATAQVQSEHVISESNCTGVRCSTAGLEAPALPCSADRLVRHQRLLRRWRGGSQAQHQHWPGALCLRRGHLRLWNLPDLRLPRRR